ncbi:sensor histidine kinase [Streptococcus intermedius]|jgi:histidine kinase|uniref:sensor histidine kinase n=1 Tax=Streptococcus intermedius TaxID=1338 RepID=UPI00029BD13A|nr:histidine kinase [Streptococcus intermedius]EKU17472.1 histidine kinase-, DNA gyrase B-, and HSP90-like ATPase family protein [Streptococcus intermedius BA1]MDK8090379.1 histidine kinase [Streptococcus intermedius]PMR64680.1 sensor histidine kinase [Streptococcus intermedius]RSJ18612.1 putative sensor-like histidine kinase [Streptococcus intermedius]RSJ20980.1 putative sensor-like histidine kinase [Streptococcus intermedius]
MKKFWLNSLLKAYAVIMIVIIGCLSFILSYVAWQGKKQEIERISQQAATRLVEEVEYYNRRTIQLAQSLVENQAKLEGVYKYFTLSPAEYASWRLSEDVPDYVQVSLHRNINNIYVENDFVKGIDIALKDYKTVFISTRETKGGKQIAAEKFKPAADAFPIAIYDKAAGQVIGTVYITVDTTIFKNIVDNTRREIPLVARIISSYNKEIAHFGENHLSKDTRWIKKETAYNYLIQVAVPSFYMFNSILSSISLIVLSGLALVVILYWSLQRIFLNYQRQVVDIVDTIQDITQGENNKRIDTATKEQELLLIATNTNTMLNSLDKNIRDIYRLQLTQKDANMRALQAQINPHFMYNTLEFIRMYAVMQSQEELADIIYEFSSLLRNNTSSETKTRLEDELEFCRKYSYLCMVRHPKSVAYGFKIDEGLKDMLLPKFSIQPLVENYFAHGIDYRRKDNVISVKAVKIAGAVRLLIQDNGCGMPPEKLAQIQQMLANRQLLDIDNGEIRKSIGIVNVHERFLLFFGERYNIQIESRKNQGVTYTIEIKDE